MSAVMHELKGAESFVSVIMLLHDSKFHKYILYNDEVFVYIYSLSNNTFVITNNNNVAGTIIICNRYTKLIWHKDYGHFVEVFR